MRGRRRRIGAQRRPPFPPSAPITPVAKHRGCDAQLPCDLRQRPTAARQQGNRLPLELIRKLTTALAHSTPFRSPRRLAKGPPIRGRHNLLFRWFVGLGVDDPMWDHSTFSKNRDRLLDGEIAAKFLSAVLAQPRVKRLLSSDHFSVDGTLIEAWASMKSFKPKEPPVGGDDGSGGRNAPSDFRGEKRSNQTHRSTTDPDARLYRKGPGMEAKLCFIGHGLMENRSGLIVDARLTGFRVMAERFS